MRSQSEAESHSEEISVPQSVFIEKLNARGQSTGFACVGFDTDVNSPRFPKHLEGLGFGQEVNIFNRKTFAAVHDLAGAVKLNSAFYEQLGLSGLTTLQASVRNMKEVDPDVPVIWDAKRGDVGNTNNGYAKLAFDILDVDAITLHPFLGSTFFDDAGDRHLDALAPFLEKKDKGMFILVKTSNDSAGEIQDLPVDLTKLDEKYRKRFGDMDELRELAGSDVVCVYQILAYRVAKFWNVYGNCGVVVGATYPEEAAEIRKVIGDIPMLMPGAGEQEGDLERAVKAGRNSENAGILVNSSRRIIFKSSGPDFAQAARQATQDLHDQINAAIAA